MRLRKRQDPSAAVELFIKKAQQYLGYTADLGGRNIFGQKVGYDAQPWAGAFIDVCAKEAGLKLPSFVYTPAALAEIIRNGSFSRDPRPGAIAIFNFSSNSGTAANAFGMPHCGIVTDVREFLANGRFITVEGNTEGASSYQKKDGVYQKVRTINDVLVFCDPQQTVKLNFNQKMLRMLDRGRTKFNGEDLSAIEEAARSPITIKLSAEVKHGDRNKRIETIQLALAAVTDLRGAEPGKWDAVTAAACARYQRVVGFVGKDASGLPDVRTLKRLSEQTGLFTID